MFEQCYYGPQKQYRVTKLSPASRYSFRLAAKNDMGVRYETKFGENCGSIFTPVFTSSWPLHYLSPSLVSSVKRWTCSPRAVFRRLHSLQIWSRLGSPGLIYSGRDLQDPQRRMRSSTFWRWRRKARLAPIHIFIPLHSKHI